MTQILSKVWHEVDSQTPEVGVCAAQVLRHGTQWGAVDAQHLQLAAAREIREHRQLPRLLQDTEDWEGNVCKIWFNLPSKSNPVEVYPFRISIQIYCYIYGNTNSSRVSFRILRIGKEMYVRFDSICLVKVTQSKYTHSEYQFKYTVIYTGTPTASASPSGY